MTSWLRKKLSLLVTRLGLDRPLVVQYGQYLKQTLSGDLGTSIVSREQARCREEVPVLREMAGRQVACRFA